MSRISPTSLLLNVGHALDHLFLLIFATAVGAVATPSRCPAGARSSPCPRALALLCGVLFAVLVPRPVG